MIFVAKSILLALQGETANLNRVLFVTDSVLELKVVFREVS